MAERAMPWMAPTAVPDAVGKQSAPGNSVRHNTAPRGCGEEWRHRRACGAKGGMHMRNRRQPAAAGGSRAALRTTRLRHREPRAHRVCHGRAHLRSCCQQRSRPGPRGRGSPHEKRGGRCPAQTLPRAGMQAGEGDGAGCSCQHALREAHNRRQGAGTCTGAGPGLQHERQALWHACSARHPARCPVRARHSCGG